MVLPKGLIEKGETPEVAAKREVREETGLLGDIVARIDTIKYTYNARWEEPPVRIFKIVTFYLLRSTGGDPTQTRPRSRPRRMVSPRLRHVPCNLRAGARNPAQGEGPDPKGDPVKRPFFPLPQ